MSPMDADARMMARAVVLARRGLYTTDPNPRVGCVLVQGGEIVGEGFHRRAGEPHAERNAIEAAGERARGATAYVTLEPCCHHGRTPPCTDALLAAGIARVVVGMEDPNPLVGGKGLARLRAAGVEVRTGVLEGDARALNPGFERRMRGGLPYVRCKLAASLDGRTAMASGESQWITSPEARRDVHRLRARSSAIVTGIGTVLADDPSMNVRLEPEEFPSLWPGELPRQPLRVVVDSRLRMPLDARMLQLPGATLIATCEDGPKAIARANAAGAEVCVLPADPAGRVDLHLLLRRLAEREINEVLIEAGPTLAGAAMALGLVNELVLYLAPHLMGDAARGLFHLPGLERMEQRIGLVIDDVRRVGVDLRLLLRRAEG
ncbi:MAG: bifunctional diaminohydroxyphosphoribosylaminopyrimidine deaminase/5-amino-6-(5-phosphoribosylamino)uracil reductase RibD [Thiohalocapsa sp.]|uniref:bifunctional diaminohydroxyphosphoribosylaminopyrimidine deaminase/5-amino-6-(5-phosphoribosylamino)uracil reductase RibD n=1 Tax=Thiohalocapsa sp. TaxID=2497641 RepID=UPI0025D082AD|nr:bifunctional diaminohydroxyphosphoribosylaminopyrimidine deaminase/5-amino-6-(5-phosphoribosylamino)uracil reductase RibD [Thiohalocapsa sp.]MCG6942067.1 bifunctional diaminohydroxyphosphoribosylaminopyrimidine deaminase/5-amino-6-(5-phosphoribosylamino)uracil reductase RibD [Thiohalocapsa sp.]